MGDTRINLKRLEDSVLALTRALEPRSSLERDGTIRRFVTAFELAWKTLAQVLGTDRPLEDNSVKGILREAGCQGLIGNVEKWFEFQHARNMTSHTYDQATAERVFRVAVQLPEHVRDALTRLRERI